VGTDRVDGLKQQVHAGAEDRPGQAPQIGPGQPYRGPPQGRPRRRHVHDHLGRRGEPLPRGGAVPRRRRLGVRAGHGHDPGEHRVVQVGAAGTVQLGHAEQPHVPGAGEVEHAGLDAPPADPVHGHQAPGRQPAGRLGTGRHRQRGREQRHAR
jgi:hypothetical protein